MTERHRDGPFTVDDIRVGDRVRVMYPYENEPPGWVSEMDAAHEQDLELEVIYVGRSTFRAHHNSIGQWAWHPRWVWQVIHGPSGYTEGYAETRSVDYDSMDESNPFHQERPGRSITRSSRMFRRSRTVVEAVREKKGDHFGA